MARLPRGRLDPETSSSRETCPSMTIKTVRFFRRPLPQLLLKFFLVLCAIAATLTLLIIVIAGD